MQTIDAAHAAGMSRGRARYWKREFNQRRMAIFSYAENHLEDRFESSTQESDQSEIVQPEPENTSEEAVGGKKGKKARRKAKKDIGANYPILPYPEPVDKPGILANDTFTEAGRKVFLAQFATILWHEAGTRSGEDIESLHDMRVATRRMRAAFDVFSAEFRKKIIKSYLSELRHLGRLLGKVRDLDVFNEKATHYLNSLPDDSRNGLDPLLAMWHAQLSEARSELVTYFDSRAYQEFKVIFNYFVQTQGYASQKAIGDTPTPNKVYEVVPCIIYTRLAKVRAYSPVINSASIPQLHALRIEFKKLRYAMEYFSEVLGSEARLVIDLVKKLQDHLGDLHDSDVACQILNNFLENWDSGQAGLMLTERQNPEPLVNYLAYQYAERHRLLVTFPDAWERFDQADVRRNISLAISVL
jgi:CHAD domain-containing protein